MKSLAKSAAMVLVTGMLASLSACAWGGGATANPTGPIQVPLAFKPTNEIQAHITLPTGNPKVFVKVIDDRNDKSEIGQNTQESPIAVVDTGLPPEQFVHDGLVMEMRKVGIAVTDSPSGADRTVKVVLKTFTVDEGNTYKAQVVSEVQVMDKSGQMVFDKTAAGESSTWGRSKNPDDYIQVFSNSLVDMTSNLLSMSDFSKSLSVPSNASNP